MCQFVKIRWNDVVKMSKDLNDAITKYVAEHHNGCRVAAMCFDSTDILVILEEI